MTKRLLFFAFRAIKILLSLSLFFFFILVIILLWWNVAAWPYLNFEKPSGSDFYNFLTYATFFKNHLTWPPLGWMHLWNAGTAVIGGYPWLTFYLLTPFYNFFDTTTAVQVLATLTLLLFFLTSFILFWVVSSSLILAFIFILILIFTKASYYSVFAGGFIAEATIHFLLPLTFILLFLFVQKRNWRFLVGGSLVVGLSLLLHPPAGTLLVLLPAAVFLIFSSFIFPVKLKYLLIFLMPSFLTGLMGLYSLLNQVLLGQGNEPCRHPYCWGVYPEHLSFFNIQVLIFPVLLLLLTIFFKLILRKIHFGQIIPYLAALLVPITFVVLAYFQLINPLAEAFFPRRVYWAISLLLLLVGALCLRLIKEKARPASSLVLSSLVLFFAIFSVIYPENFQVLVRDHPAAYPLDIEKWIVPKYQQQDLRERLPKWLPLGEDNFRFDSFNQEVNVWWNIVSSMPNSRGYSNHPLGAHRDWSYFLQSSVGNVQPAKVNVEALKNKARFLLDAYGILYHEDSGSTRLNPNIMTDFQLVKKSEPVGDVYVQFSEDMVTPIIYPTDTTAVLFVGDDTGYENFIRTIALANLNSRVLIPVKGPVSIDGLGSFELNHFPVLVLYRFKGHDWDKLKRFVDDGGNIFIESGSSSDVPEKNLPTIFPVNSLILQKNGARKWQATGFNTLFFSPLVFKDRPWTQVTADLNQVRPWVEQTFTQEGKIIMAQGRLGKGKIVWSGWNFLYHVVNFDNLEEANFFAQFIKDFTPKKVAKQPIFQIKRDNPSHIAVEAKDITGIYFKESYHPGWVARVDGQKSKIFLGGLDFLYFHSPGK